MTNKIIGIDFSPNAIKTVEIEQQVKEWKVLNYSIDYYSGDDCENSAIRALNTAIKKNNIRTKQAMVAISGPELTYQLLDLPAMPEKEIASAIRYKLSSLISFPIEEAVISYGRIEGLYLNNKHLYFVAASPKNYIANIVNIIKKAGLSAKEVIPSPWAINNPIEELGGDPYAIVYLGEHSTVIILIKQGQGVFARDIKEGGNDITRAMVGAVVTEEGKVNIDPTKAQELRDSFGIPFDLDEYSQKTELPAIEILAMMRPVLEKIESEILRTFDYYRERTGDQAEFKKAYFTGEASQIQNILEHFKAGLGIEVVPLPISIEAEDACFAKVFPSLAIALGAAIPKKACLNLLPKADKQFFNINLKSFFGFWGPAIAYVLILFLVWGFFLLNKNNLNNQLIAFKEQLRQQGEALEGGDSANATLLRLTKELGVKEKTDRFVKIMGELNIVTPKSIYFQKVSYDKNSNQLGIKGIILKHNGSSILSSFVEQLKKNSYFSTIDLSYLQETKSFAVPAFEFEIKCALNGGQ